jgi:acyl-CoA thioester hydrolase
MIQKEIQLRVRYSETDRMQYVYYGNYAQYFEVGRVETLRSLGISYKDMEEKAILLPVVEYKIKYFKPAFYDELLTIKTTIPKLPGARIIFLYETINEKGELLNAGETTLVFVNQVTMKPCAAPLYVLEKLAGFFS